MLKSWGAAETTKTTSALPSAHDEQSMMKVCLLTALAKLLFVSAAEVRPVLAQALALGIKDGHPAVRSRATFLYKLLKTDLEAARAALMSSKQSVEPFVEDADAENYDMVFDEFNTFAVIYEKPQSDWSKPQEQVTIEAEEDEGEPENEHRLEFFKEISAEDFQALWASEGVASIEDSITLGFDLDLEPFLEALEGANVGVMASGAADGGGSRIFAYGYVDGNIALIESVTSAGQMEFTIKAETEAIAEQFKDFWLGIFNE
jgi:hypothetical protein